MSYTITNNGDGTIKIDFSRETQYGVYRDALYLPETPSPTPEEIQAMEDERVNNWIYIIENPPPAPFPPQTVDIDGVTYYLLEGAPAPGAVLIEVDGYWYYKG